MTPEANLIGLYDDVGATLHLWQRALLPLRQYGLYTQHIKRADIIEHDALNPRTTRYAALVLPGTDWGSTAYRKQLNGVGGAAIRAFCASGATVVGVCAGGSWMGGVVDWRDPNLMRFTAENVGLVKGTTIGPLSLYDPFAPFIRGWFKANTTTVSIPGEAVDPRLLWWGGGHFVPDEDVNILARYKYAMGPDGQPAIAAVHKPYGAGDAVISNIHFEVSGPIMQANIGDAEIDMDVDAPKGTYRRGLVATLTWHENARQRLLMRAFQPLLDKRAAAAEQRRFG